MINAYLSNKSERQFLKEIHKCRVLKDEDDNRMVSKAVKVKTKAEFKDLKKGLTCCACLEFYDKDEVFIDCTKFHCVGEKDCSCCDKSDCKNLSI